MSAPEHAAPGGEVVVEIGVSGMQAAQDAEIERACGGTLGSG
jgi:uncharacterized protein GlcG (DUF336 family)